MYCLDRSTSITVLFAALGLLAGCSDPGTDVNTTEPPMDGLVSAAWLEQHLDDPDLVVLDSTVLIEPDGSGGLRSVNGKASYESGHIPTAGFADLLGDLSDRDSPFDFAMPSPEQFAAAMEELGVGDNDE